MKEGFQEVVAALTFGLRKDKKENQGFLVRMDLEVKEVKKEIQVSEVPQDFQVTTVPQDFQVTMVTLD